MIKKLICKILGHLKLSKKEVIDFNKSHYSSTKYFIFPCKRCGENIFKEYLPEAYGVVWFEYVKGEYSFMPYY